MLMVKHFTLAAIKVVITKQVLAFRDNAELSNQGLVYGK